MNNQLQNFLNSTAIFPGSLQVENTSRCNANCYMCPATRLRKRVGADMPREIFEKVVLNCVGQFIHQFHMHCNGEPTLIGKDEFIYRVKFAKQHLNQQGTNIGMFSNASKLTPEFSKELLETAPLDYVFFSVDGDNAKTYESVRRGLKFEEVKRNILEYAKIKTELGLNKKHKCTIVCMKNKKTENNSSKLSKIFGVEGINGVSYSPSINFAGSMDEKELHSNPKKYKVGRRITPCIRLWTNMTIMQNGNVALCCFDYEGKGNLGSIMVNTIQEIWQSEKFNSYRQMHIQKKQELIPLCKNCNYMEYQPVESWFLEL